ncbi:12988_t:CDS:2, partial [Cetraspora pellucida]
GIRELPIPGTPAEYQELYQKAWSDSPSNRPSISCIKASLDNILGLYYPAKVHGSFSTIDSGYSSGRQSTASSQNISQHIVNLQNNRSNQLQTSNDLIICSQSSSKQSGPINLQFRSNPQDLILSPQTSNQVLIDRFKLDYGYYYIDKHFESTERIFKSDKCEFEYPTEDNLPLIYIHNTNLAKTKENLFNSNWKQFINEYEPLINTSSMSEINDETELLINDIKILFPIANLEMQKVAIIINKQIKAKYRHLKPHSLLKEVREILLRMLEDELSLMNDSAIFFEDLNGNKIDKPQENSIRLREILLYNYILNITVEKHNASELIHRLKLEHGFNISENGPNKSDHKLVNFKGFCKYKLYNKNENYYETCDNEYKELHVKNHIIEGGITTILPWSKFLVGFKAKLAATTIGGHKNSTKYKIFDRIRAEFIVDECDVEPTEHFQNEVIDALKGPEDRQRENLIEITKKFGEFWARGVYLGGLALQTLNASDYHNYFQANGGHGAGVNNSDSLPNIRFEPYTAFGFETNQGNIASGSRAMQIQNLTWFGGDENIDISCDDDINDWARSIKPKNWVVVKYIKVVSVFELLNKELRDKVLRVFGKTIFYSKIDSLNFTLDLSKMEPYAYELSIPKNIPSADYQIFAMIMSKSKQDDVFGMRIVYENDKKPVILLHRIGNKTKPKLRRKDYSLNIGWVVIGYSNKFDFGKYKIDRSLVSEKVSIDLKGSSIKTVIIPHSYQNDSCSLLGICTLRLGNDVNTYDYRRSTIVTAQHFHDKSNGLSSCVFAHDLYKRKYNDILQELKDLTFEYSIINDQANSKQVIITWDKSILSRPKILSGTIKNLDLNLGHPTFLTLLYDDGYRNCSNEFVNICDNCVTLRSLCEFNQQNSLAVYYCLTD